MEQFLETYKPHLITAVVIIGAYLMLRLLTNLLHKWLLKKEFQKIPDASRRPINLVQRVLNVLWLILACIALSSIFVDREKDAALTVYFKLAGYLGFLAVLTILAATAVNVWFKVKIKEKIENEFDPTSYKFLRYVVVFIICFVGILFGLLAFPSLRGVAQTALGGAGVIALIAGVASQEALSNLVGGVFIISFKPFKIGDIIKVTDTMVGKVTDITLRHTVIRNFENKMIVIPNAIINKEKLINYDLGELKCCEHVEIEIAFDSDIDLAKKILQNECEKHPLIYDNRTLLEKKDGKAMVRTALIKLNDSSMTIRAWAWSENFTNSFALKCDVFESVVKRFAKEGVEIPYPYRSLVFKQTLANEGEDEQAETKAQTK